MQHIQETLQLLTVMTHDHRYEDVYNDAEEGVAETMCEVLERIENKGIALGEARGEEKKARESAAKLYKRGDDPADIADIVGYTVDTVKKWLGLLPA